MPNEMLTLITDAVQSASAISLRANLIPASGCAGDEQFFLMPPTFAEVGHLVSPLREDGTHQYVLVDSPQSWANRLEELLDDPRAALPCISVSVAGRTLTVNQLPHRVFDALLRDSERDGLPFRSTALGKSLADARADNATAMLQHAPGVLLFGAWDSFSGAKVGAAKWPAALSGQIMGFNALLAEKAGVRTDPIGITLDDFQVFKSPNRAEGWTIDEAAAEKDGSGKPIAVRPSEVGHGSILASRIQKGAWVSGIELRSSLSLTRLRRYRFPIDGVMSESRDVAARTYLAALAAWGMTERLARGLDLRAGAELDPVTATLSLRRPLVADMPLPLDAELALSALQQAKEKAESEGFNLSGAEHFVASEKLEQIIARSKEISA